MSLISALRRQRQADLCNFKVSVVNRVSSRTGSKATEKACLKQTNKTTKKSMSKRRAKVVVVFQDLKCLQIKA